ncbi:MAG: PAS domain-containing protein, partial [Acidobacteriota bacterium]
MTSLPALASAPVVGLTAWAVLATIGCIVLWRRWRISRRDRSGAVERGREAERRLAERTSELHEADRFRHLLAKAVETMSLGVTMSDRDGKIIYVNPADARMHGYGAAELIGVDSRIYAADIDASVAPTRASPEPWARERMNVTKTGELVPVRLVSDR